MMFGTLLKLKISEKISSFKSGKIAENVLGLIFKLILFAAGVYIVVTVSSAFAQKYAQITLNGVYDPVSRGFELTAFTYEIVFVFGLAGAIAQINREVFQNPDRIILSTLPIKASDIFYAKLFRIYIKQAALCLAILAPLNLSFAAATGQSAYFTALSLLSCLFYPIIIIFFASALALPVYIIKSAVKNRYIFILIFATAVMGLLFRLYSDMLEFIEKLMSTGEIKFFFSEAVMNSISDISKWLFPANLAAGILMKKNAAVYASIFAASILLSGVGGFFIIKALFYKPVDKLYAGGLCAKAGGKTRGANALRKNANSVKKFNKLAKKPVFWAFFFKEANEILRTPAYAVQYFSVAALIPLMVYCCMRIGSDFLLKLFFAQKNLELAIFLTALFGTLTNTFCASNISRDGNVFINLKTMPVRCADIVGAKLLLNGIVSVTASGASALTLGLTGYIGAGESVFVFIVSVLLAAAQIFFATRLDLNKPAFLNNQMLEVRESDATVYTVVLCGLLCDFTVGGIPLFNSVWNSFKGADSVLFTYLFAFFAAAAAAGAAFAFLYVGIDKRFKNLTENAQ